MSQLNVSIPPALKAWIESRVAEGRFSSASDYVRHLLRLDQDAAADETEWVRAKLAEGMNSPIIDKEPEDIIEDIIAERHAKRG